MLNKLKFLFYGCCLHLLCGATLVSAGGALEQCGAEAKSCVQYGARVFQERCSLCHGVDGMGEGLLPLSLEDYPDSNLMTAKLAKNREDIREVTLYGSSLPHVGAEMPPWGDELTVAQLDSVVDFVVYMRQDLEGALDLLHSASRELEPSLRVGRAVFVGRCSLCHGAYGQGDGRMARVIKDPPPYNLTLSGAPDEYLHQIISNGGAEMKRSPKMPPFGGDLSENEIRSVIMFLKTLRI